MSLINDALRRASQTEKNRQNRTSPPIGMEAVPEARQSKLTMLLGGVVLIALLLACLFFWQWWKMRNNSHSTAKEPNIFPPVVLQPVAAPAATPKPFTPAVGTAVLQATPAKPAPAPVVVAAPPVVAAPVAAPVAAKVTPVVWPADLKISAIFFSRTNPRVLIDGSTYGVGDQVDGVTIKKIGIDKVTFELNGQTKDLSLQAQ